jgi:predicted glycogen debranching enzyme
MKLPSIILRGELSKFDDAIHKEWLVTNGLGGYASSTVLGINTRKYHGLLVAAFHPPGDRRVCLEKLDEEISIGNRTYPLSANEFQGAIFPQGYSLLKEFSVSPFPKYVYNVQDVEVQKSILMPHEKNAAIIIYHVANKGSFDAKIRVFPIVNWRYFHSVTNRWKNQWSLTQKQKNDEVSVDLSNPKAFLMLQTTSGHYTASGNGLRECISAKTPCVGKAA